MWPFNGRKNRDAKNVPPEVQEYYATERRERVGVAWLLALGTLLVTIALALALFFGGRWIYRKVAHKDKPATGTSQTQPATQAPQTNTNTGGSTPSAPSSSTAAPAPTPTQGSSTPATSTPSATAAPTPSTANGQLTNTGPGDTVAIFLGVTVLGVLVYQAAIRQKLNN